MDRTLERVTLMADDLGRLRRSGVDHWALERLCQNVEVVDAMLRPSAGELVARGWVVREALGRVDGERGVLLGRMGVERT